MIKWYRSWPYPVEQPDYAFTPHVNDTLPKLLMHSYDYRSVENWPTDTPGICLLEWDVALDVPSRNWFSQIAARNSHLVHVATYYMGQNDSDYRYGFGCVYLPLAIVNIFLSANVGYAFSDGNFFNWYRQLYGEPVHVFGIHPQHLHEYH